MIQPEQDDPHAVLWTSRHAWLDVLFLIIWSIAFHVGIHILMTFNNFNPNISITILSLAEITLLVPLWWFTIRKYNTGIVSLGFRKFTLEMTGTAFGLLILFYVFNIVYNVFITIINALTDSEEIHSISDYVELATELPSPWLIVVAAIIIAPIVEELFFRGFLFSGLQKRYTWKKSAFISSSIFALLHVPIITSNLTYTINFFFEMFLPIFFIGYILAYLYYRSRSILLPMLVHCAINSISLFGYFLLEWLY